MITKINNIDEINRIIYGLLVNQSELTNSQVRNAVSVYGQDLIKEINNYAYQSYEPTNSFMLFELISNDSTSDFSETQDDIIHIHSSYTIHCYIYGYSSLTLCNTLMSRLRTEEVKLYLQNLGVYLQDISNRRTLNDFINETMFPRTDFDINITCESIVNQIHIEDDYKKADFEIIVDKENTNG